MAGNPEFPMDYELDGLDNDGQPGKLKLHFSIPASMALRWELASSDNPERARFAALGLASAAVRKHVPYRHQSTAAYGLAVADWLLERGVKYPQALDCATVAWLHCIHDLVSESEVKAAEDFSEAPER